MSRKGYVKHRDNFTNGLWNQWNQCWKPASGTSVGKDYLALHDEQHLPHIKWMLHSYSSDIFMNGTSEIHHPLRILNGRGLDAPGKRVRRGQKSAVKVSPQLFLCSQRHSNTSRLSQASWNQKTLNRHGKTCEDGQPDFVILNIPVTAGNSCH